MGRRRAIADQAGAQLSDVAAGNANTGARCGPIRVVGVQDEVLGRSFKALTGGATWPNIATEDPFHRVAMVWRD